MLLLLRTHSVAPPSPMEPLAIGAVTIARDDSAVVAVVIEHDGINPGFSLIERDTFAIDPAFSVIERV